EDVSHALRHAETICRGMYGRAGVSREVSNGLCRVVVSCVEAGADCRRAQIQFEELLRGALHFRRRVRDVCRESSEFLTERDWHGVLQMCPAGLEYVGELPAFLGQAVGEHPCGVQEQG